MQQPEGAAVHVDRRQDLVPVLEVRLENCMLRRQAGAKHRSVGAAFEVGEHGLEPLPRRIVRTCVVETPVLPGRDLLIGRGLEQRRNDGAGLRFAVLGGVDGACRELHGNLTGKSEVKSQKQVGSGEEGEEEGERYEEGRPAVETSVPVPLRLRTMSGRPCAAASTRASRWTSGQPVSAFSIARWCVRCGMGRARRSIAGSAVK